MISSVISRETLNGNRLLALLTPESQRRVLPLLKLISLEINRPLYEPHELIIPLYFPVTAVTSVFSEMGGTVGREGMVGLSRFLRDETMVLSCVALPGTALAVWNPSSSAIAKRYLVSSPSSRLVIDRIRWASGARGGF
jgi:hypothetical protein